MSDIRRGFASFGQFVLYGIILYFLLSLQDYVSVLATRTADLKAMFIFPLIIPSIFGMTLSLPRLIKTRGENGSWTLDFVKLTSIVLPSLIVALLPQILFFTPVGHLPLGFLLQGKYLSYNFYFLARVVFGYSLVTSLVKSEFAVLK